MSKRAKLSEDVRTVIAWLERQPGVASVAQGRYTGSRHSNDPGTVRLGQVTAQHVNVRAYDRRGVKDLTVYAPKSDLRDRWISEVATGRLRDERVERPRVAPVHGKANVAMPEAQVMDAEAGTLVNVTPELAVEWLEHNTRNRKLRQSVVDRYAADMKAGRWLVTGDAIAFDRNGAIVNGQHRLWAVMESGLTVPMLVARDLAPEVVSVLDDHLKRSLTDVAEIARPGSTVSTSHAAVAKMLISTSLAGAVDRTQAMARVSRQTQLDMLDRHWDAIEFAIRECFHSRKLRHLTVAPVLTPLARAYYSQDREKLRRFGAVFLGEMPEPGENAALLLRNFMLRSETSKVRQRVDQVYRKTERAIEAMMAGERLRVLYEASGELFPLPEEKAKRTKA